MYNIIKIIFNIFAKKKSILFLMFSIQIMIFIILILVGNAVINIINLDNDNSFIISSSNYNTYYLNELDILYNDDKIENIIVTFDNNIIADCNSNNFDNLASNGNYIIIGTKDIEEEIIVGDYLEIFDRNYEIIETKNISHSEINYSSLQGNEEIEELLEIKIYSSNHKYNDYLGNQIENIYSEEFNIVYPHDVSLLNSLKDFPLAFIILIALTLLSFATIIICNKQFNEVIRKLNQILRIIGYKDSYIRTIVLIVFFVTLSSICIISTLCYLIIISIIQSDLNAVMGGNFYMLKIIDYCMIYFFYIIVFFTSLVVISYKNKKNIIRREL